MVQNEEITNSLDATLGLIYRLNILWRNVDMYSSKGEYDEWNNELDGIFRNLLFEKDLKVLRDHEGKMIGVRFDEEDYKIYQWISTRIFNYKNSFYQEKHKSKNSTKLPILRSQWYESLMLKDAWLRKLMFREKLYLNRKKSAPGTALFGSFASKRR